MGFGLGGWSFGRLTKDASTTDAESHPSTPYLGVPRGGDLGQGVVEGCRVQVRGGGLFD